MGEIAFTNGKKHAVTIGNKTVYPGCTRMVEETLVPGYKPAAPETPAEDPNAELLKLLDANVKEIEAVLPDLDDDQLATLLQAEENGHTRKGVIKAITELQLERADAASQWVEFQDQIAGASLEQLRELETQLIEAGEEEKADFVAKRILELEAANAGS